MAMTAPPPSSALFCPETSILFICDIQERFRELIHRMPHVIYSASLLNEAAAILSIPVMVTEQYPKALLHTVAEIDVEGENTTVFEKTMFSMVTPVGVASLLDKIGAMGVKCL